MTPNNTPHTRTIETPNVGNVASLYVPITPAENILAYYRVMEQTGCYEQLEDAIRYHINRLNECINDLNIKTDIKASITEIEHQITTLKDNTDGILEALAAIQMEHYRNHTEMVCDE